MRTVTIRTTFTVVAMLLSVLSVRADLSECEAIKLVRRLPEFREFQRFAHRHHSEIDIGDTELVTEASRIDPPALHVPAWRISVTHSVIDDPATGDGHNSKWNEFLVDARAGTILVLWRVGDPYRYVTLADWRRMTRELMKKTEPYDRANGGPL